MSGVEQEAKLSAEKQFLRIYNILGKGMQFISTVKTDQGEVVMLRHGDSEGDPYEATISFENITKYNDNMSLKCVWVDKEGVKGIEINEYWVRSRDRRMTVEDMFPWANREIIKKVKLDLASSLANFLEEQIARHPQK